MNTLIYALFPYYFCQQPRLVYIFYCCAHCFTPRLSVYEAEITIHVSNHVTLEGFIFFKMHFDNPCTGKEYPKDETKQTKIQANVIWKPSIIVERFSVSYNCCIIARSQITVTEVGHAVTAWTSENEMIFFFFWRNWEIWQQVVNFLYLLLLIDDAGWRALCMNDTRV